MSSSKLDQSLEEIAGSRRGNARRGRRQGPKPAAPRASGGITKNTATKATKASIAKTARKPAAPLPQTTGPSKISVSNLPSDVTEQMIKEYFTKNVGPIRKVLLSYDKNGRSLGVATIIFAQPNHAAQAARDYDGIEVDKRPMKIEVILGAQFAPALVKPKGLSERISQPRKETAKPKPKPKPATAAPKAAANGATEGAGRGGRNKKGRAGRPKPKSVEELDAEMSEYFVPSGNTDAAAPNTNGAAPAAAPALDATMDEGVL